MFNYFFVFSHSLYVLSFVMFLKRSSWVRTEKPTWCATRCVRWWCEALGISGVPPRWSTSSAPGRSMWVHTDAILHSTGDRTGKAGDVDKMMNMLSVTRKMNWSCLWKLTRTCLPNFDENSSHSVANHKESTKDLQRVWSHRTMKRTEGTQITQAPCEERLRYEKIWVSFRYDYPLSRKLLLAEVPLAAHFTLHTSHAKRYTPHLARCTPPSACYT